MALAYHGFSYDSTGRKTIDLISNDLILGSQSRCRTPNLSPPRSACSTSNGDNLHHLIRQLSGKMCLALSRLRRCPPIFESSDWVPVTNTA